MLSYSCPLHSTSVDVYEASFLYDVVAYSSKQSENDIDVYLQPLVEEV